MPGDYSRQTFRQKQHYSGVLEQQGRVQTDADWNEQLEIQLYRTHTESTDVIGQSGVPKENNGFEIKKSAGGNDLAIGAGRIYVEGLLCELEDSNATYANQPYLTNPDFTGLASPPSSPPGSRQLNLPAGNYVAYLDAWQREITALDDKLIREVALGGPDTTTRLQTVWQVRLLKVGETSPPSSPPASCKTPFADFDKLTAAANGKLNARTQPVAPEDNPCLLPPTAGYNRLENQLYRVEIHKGGPLDQATFKWSRDNGSVETKIKKIAGSVLTVSDTGKDEALGFAAGEWIEIVDDEATLKSTPHSLAQIDKIGPGPNEITLKTDVDQFKNGKGLKLRRWDQTTGAADTGLSITLAPPSSPPGGPSSIWIDLEGGVQVQFSCDTLGETNFRAGDYWLIPARTVTGEIEWPPYEIPNLNPIAQAPRGIARRFCRLALITSDGTTITKIEDCRKKFPSLTTICAEDICFENDKCDFAGAETVQDALDRLCSANDLRFHNKHLHGWGIVCGLQVYCCTDEDGESCKDDAGRPGRFVTINGGYAIDCEGNDIVVKGENKLDVFSLIGPQTSPSTDGEWCLVLDPSDNKDVPFRIEPYKPPKKNWQSILAGTLLADVFQDCIQSLIDFVKQEFTVQPGEEKTPVGPTQKRITTFGNLLIQLINKQNGSFVFLSGDKGKSDPNFEDTILRNFYHKLREKLQSHTFCAMFENARPFPDYPYTGTQITTIFGKGYQKRVRIAPGGKAGYSVGAGKTINVYDLEKGEMVVELEFPGGTSAIVQDVAFSKNGKQLYAVATLENKDSMFAVADVNGFEHKWGKPTVICDVLLMTIGTLVSSKSVFAAGKNKGLYVIDPDKVEATPKPIHAFNAVGHLVISNETSTGFLSANNGGSATDVYNQVLAFNLTNAGAPQVSYNLTSGAAALNGQDDIALGGDKTRLYVVLNPPAGKTTKHVAVFDLAAPQAPKTITDLGEKTGIRLAYNSATNFTMVTYEDSYRVGLLDQKDQFVTSFRHPVQISPMSIAVAPDNKCVYVLNYASNTLNSIPAEFLDPKKQLPLQPLVDYRAGVLNAFADLLGGLIQYLKDCFCDHFLVNCPECDPDDKLYLACITIKNGKVFKVCNFSLRKYVHSFPTVEYWLSVIPIIPVIKKAVETFCCAALPGFFGKFQAPAPKAETASAPAQNTLKSEHVTKGITYAQQADFRGGFSRTLTAAAPAAKLFTDAAKNTTQHALVRDPGAVQHSEIVNTSAGDASKKLEAANVTVDKVEPYDPNKAGHNLIKFAGAPPQLRSGMRVNLVTDNDKVLFYTLADEPSTPAELREEIDATRTTVEQHRKALDEALPALDNLRTELANNKAAVSENQTTLQKLSPQLDELRTRLEADSSAHKAVFEKISPQLQDMQNKIDAGAALAAANKAAIDQTLPRLENLTAAIDANRVAIEKSTPQLAELKTRVEAAATAAAEAKTAATGAGAFQDQVNSLRAELLKQQQANKEELVARDKQITDLQGEFRKSLTGINERLKKFPNIP